MTIEGSEVFAPETNNSRKVYLFNLTTRTVVVSLSVQYYPIYSPVQPRMPSSSSSSLVLLLLTTIISIGTEATFVRYSEHIQPYNGAQCDLYVPNLIEWTQVSQVSIIQSNPIVGYINNLN